jgi:16S rRNA (guanine527-N7)-methyltransferase
MGVGLPRAGIEQVAGPLTADQVKRLSLYADKLAADAERMSLISRHELPNLGRHILDSAALLAFRDLSSEEVADLGTGGGLPGVVLSILRPKVKVALIDSRRSRVVFLKSVQRLLGLENIEVVHARLEELAGVRSFPLAVARALGRLDRVLEMSLGVVEAGGSLVLYKGPRWSEEAEEAGAIAERGGAWIERVEGVELPGADRTTTFVEFRVGGVSRETDS